MALSTVQLESDAAFIVKDDLPLSITIPVSGTVYTGTQMSVRQARESAAEGLRDRYVFSVYLLISDLSSVPAVDSLVTVGGVDYVILAKNMDDPQDILRLDLGEKYGGR